MKRKGGISGTREPEEISDVQVGLGWVAHLTAMVSCLMGVPLRSSGVVMKQEKDHCIHLRYPTTSAGSRSTVEDLILDRFDPNVFNLQPSKFVKTQHSGYLTKTENFHCFLRAMNALGKPRTSQR